MYNDDQDTIFIFNEANYAPVLITIWSESMLDVRW